MTSATQRNFLKQPERKGEKEEKEEEEKKEVPVRSNWLILDTALLEGINLV